jgi:hypothetical protein
LYVMWVNDESDEIRKRPLFEDRAQCSPSILVGFSAAQRFCSCSVLGVVISITATQREGNKPRTGTFDCSAERAVGCLSCTMVQYPRRCLECTTTTTTTTTEHVTFTCPHCRSSDVFLAFCRESVLSVCVFVCGGGVHVVRVCLYTLRSTHRPSFSAGVF